MSTAGENASAVPGEFASFLGLLWRDRWWVVGIAAIVIAGGVAYALLAEPRYRAEVVLSPTDARRGLSGALGQLSGLANLAGVNLASPSERQPLAVLRSQDFARDFIEDQRLTPILMGDETDPEKANDPRDALRVFDERVRSVVEDKKTGLVTLGIVWKDPVVAAQWANLLAMRLNDRVRAQVLAESERNVRYLQSEMAATSVVSLQQSIGRVLENEMQKLMLAKGNDEFAFRIIDGASPPKYREHPKRTVIVIASGVLGAALAVLFVYLRSIWLVEIWPVLRRANSKSVPQ